MTFVLDIPHVLAHSGRSAQKFTDISGEHIPSSNVSTTPFQQWGFRQCLPVSWTPLRDKLCRHPIAVMGVVDVWAWVWVMMFAVKKMEYGHYASVVLGQY